MAEIITRRPLLALEPVLVPDPMQPLETALVSALVLCVLLVIYFTRRIRHEAQLHEKQKKLA